MLEPLTHPIACLIYFIALGVGLHKLLGVPRSTFGFLGRVLLFFAGSLGVSVAVVLTWSHQLNVSLESIYGLIFIPALILLLPILGTLAAALTSRPREVLRVTMGVMSVILFLLLSNLYPF